MFLRKTRTKHTSKPSDRGEIIKIRAEINEIEMKKVSVTKSQFFEKIKQDS